MKIVFENISPNIINFNRLNSNIYKNIFPENIFDYEYVTNALSKITVTGEIRQENHGFDKYDVVYLDTNDNLYKKALAEDSEKAFPVGIVETVLNPNAFILYTKGSMDYPDIHPIETSILYLSDKIPGKMVSYQDIDNLIYIPIALYTGKSIIINILQGSIGDKLAPYTGTPGDEVDEYTQTELDNTINTFRTGLI